MLPLVVLITLGVLEIFVFVQVGQWVGFGWAILLLIAISLLGVWLVKREGLGTWRRAQAQMRAGEIPAGEVVDGALIAGAGILLIVPGFITDVVGLLLLLPPLRWPARRWVQRHRYVRTGNVVYGRVIDVRGTGGPPPEPPTALPPADPPPGPHPPPDPR